MNQAPQDRLNWILRQCLLVCALYFVLAYLYIAFFRVAYPFELEWMEGLSVDTVRRVLAGEPIYTRPSIEYVPYIYTPLYFYVSALFYDVMGGGFLPLRLVSFLSTVGSCAFIFAFVVKETEDRYLGVCSVGLFMATFEWCGSWFDIARCDSLFVLLLLASFYTMRFKKKLVWHMAAALLMWLAFMTKQTGLSMAVALLGCAAVLHGKRSAVAVGAALVMLIAGSIQIMNVVSDGWFGFFAFELVTQHGWRHHALREYWESDLGRLSTALTIGVFFALVRGLESRWRELSYYGFMTVSMLGAAWLSRLHGGGFRNVLMPAFAMVAILFGLGMHALPKFFENLSETRGRLLTIVVTILCVLQFVEFYYAPREHIPSTRDREAGQRMVERLSTIEGDVLFMWHGYYSTLASDGSYTLGMSLSDVLRARREDVRDQIVDEINEAILQQRFGAIIIDNTSGFFGGAFNEAVERCYRVEGKVFRSEHVFWPRTGFRTRPEDILVPSESRHCPHLVP